MSIFDDVRREIRYEQDKYGQTADDRINNAAEAAKNRIVNEIKYCIKHNIQIQTSFPFASKKYVIVEMPPIYVSSHVLVTPCYSPESENSSDCYFVKSNVEESSFLRAVQVKLEKEGISCKMKPSAYRSGMVLHCKYGWKE